MSDWAIWAALIVAVLAGTAALALLLTRVLRAWRDVNDTRRDVLNRLDDFSRKAAAVSEKLAAANETTTELQGSLERLRVSLAQLAVLRAALDEVDGTVARVAAYLPRK
jgi:septal ring factor EnvC (AmiA/AmiB activator)